MTHKPGVKPRAPKRQPVSNMTLRERYSYEHQRARWKWRRKGGGSSKDWYVYRELTHGDHAIMPASAPCASAPGNWNVAVNSLQVALDREMYNGAWFKAPGCMNMVRSYLRYAAQDRRQHPLPLPG